MVCVSGRPTYQRKREARSSNSGFGHGPASGLRRAIRRRRRPVFRGGHQCGCPASCDPGLPIRHTVLLPSKPRTAHGYSPQQESFRKRSADSATLDMTRPYRRAGRGRARRTMNRGKKLDLANQVPGPWPRPCARLSARNPTRRPTPRLSREASEPHFLWRSGPGLFRHKLLEPDPATSGHALGARHLHVRRPDLNPKEAGLDVLDHALQIILGQVGANRQ